MSRFIHRDIGRRPAGTGTWLSAVLGLTLLATAFAHPAQALDKVTVVTVATTGGSNAVFVGKGKGLFEQEGIDLEILKVPAATALPPAVASGDADIGVGSLSAGFFNIAGNGDFRLVAGTTIAKPGFSQAIIMASTAAYNKGFTGAAQLPGKKIAVSSTGGFAHYMLYLIAEKYHFAFDSVQTPQFGSDGNALAAMVSGAADGALGGSAALAVPIEKAGQGKIIIRTGDEVTALSNVMFTSSKDIANRRDVLVRFMRAYLKSAQLYATVLDPRDASGNLVRTPQTDELLNMIASTVALPVDSIIPALTYVEPDAALDPSEIEKQLVVWKKLNLTDAKVDGSKLVDLSILQAAQKQ